MDRIAALRTMMLIRSFEARLMARPDHGFQLYSSGEEAVAAGVASAMRPGDQLLSGGRSIGPALASGLDSGAVLAELLGKAAGPNRGRAGRGHLSCPESGFFGAHAVVAGNLTIAAGVALACKQAGEGAIALSIFGDGACGAGALHETLNVAALWKLPLVLVCGNNGLSISTPVSQGVAAEPLSRLAEPFGIPHASVDGMDVGAVMEAAGKFAAHARGGKGPALLECRAERFMSHSSATRETRSDDEIEEIRARCPIVRLSRELLRAAELDEAGFSALQRDVEAEVDRAVAFAEASPFPPVGEALSDVG
ncbi:MAG: thiamine pyrophosphate-dependent dehydrogenase E1 component subunit alpha [Novosphingobium sp.]|nr:thiamine pyrophosphate-dependent dehydrogenase E1 component subunit alpha [Novosphingobium sp.]